MARYLDTASDLRKEVNSFMEAYVKDNHPMVEDSANMKEAAVQLGHIINLAVRCSPRAVQGTVRKNIVATAMGKFCEVAMTQEVDEKTGRNFNKIHITPKG